MQENVRFRGLFEKYADMIYRIGVSYCSSGWMAEDVVQEVFIRYLKKEPQFESEEHEKAWFIRVAINCCKSEMLSSWVRKIIPTEDCRQEDTMSIEFHRTEESELFEQLLQLPIKYRMVLYLRYYEEYSVNEIGEILGIAPNTVSARLTRARKRMREQCEKNGLYPNRVNL